VAADQVPGTAIKQPFPAGPPNRLARAYCRVAGHTGDWTYPDERCVGVRMCKRCGDVTSKQEHTWSSDRPRAHAGAAGDGPLQPGG